MARRKKNLGSVSRTHIQQADYAVTSLSMYVENAQKAYARGQCRVAGQQIDKAYLALGKATAHLTSAEKSPSQAVKVWDNRDAFSKRLYDLDEKFEATCVRRRPERKTK